MALPPKKPTFSTAKPTSAAKPTATSSSSVKTNSIGVSAPGIAPSMPSSYIPSMPGIGGGVAPGQKAPGYVAPLGPTAIGGSMASKPPTTSTAKPTPAPTPIAGKYKPFVR